MKYTFSKSEKLCSVSIFEKLFSEGKSVSKFPMRWVFVETNLPAPVPFQFSFSAPKRNFKKAVSRNRIKRQLREIVRLNKPDLIIEEGRQFAIAVVYLGKKMPTYQELERSYKHCAEKFVHSITLNSSDSE